MKFLNLTFSYLKKNILYLLILAILPTVFVGVLLKPFSLFEFINKYPSTIINGYGTIFNMLYEFKILNIILSFFGLIILSVFVSIIIGQQENHMRSGKLNLKNSVSMVNNNFIVVFVNFLIMFLIFLVFQFLYSGIICLTHLIICGMGTMPNVWCEIIAIIMASIFFIFYVQICAIFLLNIPNMLLNGYPAKQAFSNSIKLLNRNNFQFIVALILPFAIIIPLCSVLSFTSVSVIATIVGVLILTIYIPTLIMTGYFELSNTSRYDNRKYYNYNFYN